MAEPLSPAEREAIRQRLRAFPTEENTLYLLNHDLPRLLDALERCQEERDAAQVIRRPVTEMGPLAAYVTERALADRLAEHVRDLCIGLENFGMQSPAARAVLASYDEKRHGQ